MQGARREGMAAPFLAEGNAAEGPLLRFFSRRRGGLRR